MTSTMLDTSTLPALDAISWDQPLFPAAPDKEVRAYAAAKVGRCPPFLDYLGPVPWLARSMIDLFAAKRVVYAPSELLDIVALVTSQENACRHCYGAQRAVMKLQGYSEDRIRDLEREVQLASGLTRATVDFARKLSRSNPRPATLEREALMAAGVSAQAVAEIAFFIALTCFNNRIATFAAFPTEAKFEALPSSLLGRLFRPFIATKVRLPRSEPVAGPATDGPYGDVFSALQGIPGAVALRSVIDGCMSSPGLPLRTRVLIGATVARALVCPLCQTSSRNVLLTMGLSDADLDEILGSLDSPLLTPLERDLLPWARETIRYEPAVIQKRTRALVAKVGVPVALEAIGTASLGNMLSRLAMLTT